MLISILQFSMQDRSNLRWLEGENGNEMSIYGAMPGSAPFLEYALSTRAASLLGVSQEWWSDPVVFRLRYEELVADTEGELRRLAEWVGVSPRCPFGQVVEKTTLSHMRQRIGEAGDIHVWQGRAGLWKTLLTASIAEQIAQAHPASFGPLGYPCDPDSNLTPSQADANWIRFSSTVSEKLQQFRSTRQQLAEAQQNINHLLAEQAALTRNYQHVEAERQRVEAERQRVEAEYQRVEAERQHWIHAYHTICAELAPFKELGPIPLKLARCLRNLSHSHPRLAAMVKGFGRSCFRGVQSVFRF